MPGGRPPKPTALKALQGNPGKRPLNGNEPRPPAGTVKPPSWLKGKARTAWRWLAAVLEEMGVLTTADPHALGLLCDAYAEYIEARAIVRKLGAVYESRVVKASSKRVSLEEEAKGEEEADTSWSVMIRPRPEVAMAADAWRRIHRMLTEFGLTPSSRSKLHPVEAEEKDPFAEFLGRRGTAKSG